MLRLDLLPTDPQAFGAGVDGGANFEGVRIIKKDFIEE